MKNKTQIIEILIGAPGSGKSTYAQKRVQEDSNCAVISRDAYCKMLRLKFGNTSEKIEKAITEMAYRDLAVLMNAKLNIIIDNTHCRMEVLNELVEKISKFDRFNNYVIKFQIFDPTLNELYKRNETRPEEKKVPKDVIERMFKNLQILLNMENRKTLTSYENGFRHETAKAPRYNNDLEDAIIVDIDGTVAHMGNHRGPFEWNKVHLDDPDDSIIDLVYKLGTYNHIIFMSGRSEEARDLTELWLNENLLGPKGDYQLFMRPAGDYRKDSIVKEELFRKHVEGKYNVSWVLDDRQQVVDMWREVLGLKVLQVAAGDF